MPTHQEQACTQRAPVPAKPAWEKPWRAHHTKAPCRSYFGLRSKTRGSGQRGGERERIVRNVRGTSDPTMRNLTSRVKHLDYVIITWSLPNPAATKTTATPWCQHLPPTNAMRSATTSRFGHRSQGFHGIHTVCPRSEQPLQSHETLSQCLVR